MVSDYECQCHYAEKKTLYNVKGTNTKADKRHINNIDEKERAELVAKKRQESKDSLKKIPSVQYVIGIQTILLNIYLEFCRFCKQSTKNLLIAYHSIYINHLICNTDYMSVSTNCFMANTAQHRLCIMDH